MELIYIIGIIIFALAGAFLSGYILKVKNKKGYFKHPSSVGCDIISHSRFSRFFGVHNEVIRLTFYSIVVFFYIANLIFHFPPSILFFMLVFVSLGFLFDLRLIFIQLIVLKKWCTTCLGSSAASFMITVLAFLGFQASFGSYLFEVHDVLSWVFIFTVLIGVIGSTLYASTFIKFLRDFEISKKESQRLSMLSHMGWVAIFLVALSGTGLVLTDIYGNITGSAKFMPILIVFGTVIAYEIIVNMFIAPKLIDLHFGDHPEIEDHKHAMLRKTSFAFVIVGVVSWYVLLLFVSLHFYGYSPITLLVAYVILLFVAVGISQYAEYLYYKRSTLVYETLEEVPEE